MSSLSRPRRRALPLLLFTVAAALLAPAGRVFAYAPRPAAAPPRPLVVLYPTRLDAGPRLLAANPKEADGAAELTRRVCRTARDLMEDSNAVTATVFSPDSPLFLRAAQEAKIVIGRRREVTSDEQVALGKVAGAVYVVAVWTQPVPNDTAAVEIVVQGQDLESRKVWNDRARFSLPGASAPRRTGDGNAVRGPVSVQQSESGLVSAVNTLVLRILTGPLGDYGRAAPPKTLQPTAVAGAAAADPSPEAEAAQAALNEATVMLEQGDSSAAITLLRRAVSRSPLNARLRVLLTRAYLAARRPDAAASEAKRALQITPPDDGPARAEMTRLVADAFAKSGDRNAARAAYEEVIAGQPSATWARLALADLYLSENRGPQAEAQYRAALKAEPDSREAAIGLARVVAANGDFKAALAGVAPEGAAATPAQQSARHAAAVVLFDEFAPQFATLLVQNRQAWEAKTLSREVFYKATASQQAKTAALLAMLRAAPPAEADAAATRAHARRIHAASLLAQAASSLMNHLETGNAESGSQAALWLSEFRRELAQAQARP